MLQQLKEYFEQGMFPKLKVVKEKLQESNFQLGDASLDDFFYEMATFPQQYSINFMDQRGLEIRVGSDYLVHENSRAFILVDMQKIFLRNVNQKKREAMIIAQKKVLQYCAEYDIPIAVVQYDMMDDTIDTLMAEVKNVPRFAIFEKNRNNGFINPLLKKQLDDWGTKEVYLMGLNASSCVKETAESALENGFRVITSKRLIADNWARDEKKSEAWYKENGTYLR